MEIKEVKTLAAKEWVKGEGLTIWYMEHHMDIDMFLDEYLHWETEGLHCPLILQEMFLQAAHMGRREAEWMICQGCQHGLLCLDLQMDVFAMQSVGSHNSREDISNLYY